jgi:hypothetical protein
MPAFGILYRRSFDYGNGGVRSSGTWLAAQAAMQSRNVLTFLTTKYSSQFLIKKFLLCISSTSSHVFACFQTQPYVGNILGIEHFGKRLIKTHLIASG